MYLFKTGKAIKILKYKTVTLLNYWQCSYWRFNTINFIIGIFKFIKVSIVFRGRG